MRVYKYLPERTNASRYFFSAYTFLLVSALCFLFSGCSNNSRLTGLSLGNNGNLNTIIIPVDAGGPVVFAAAELQSYFKKITGKAPEIKKTADTEEHAIRLIMRNDTSFKWDGFKIETDANNINLVAREGRGLLYAAYTLLEEAGCSFFYPGEKEEIIPHRDLIRFEEKSTVFNPVLEHRGLAPYGLQASSVETGRNFISWMAKNKLNYILVSENRPSDSDGPANGSVWKEVTHELLPELQKRGFVIEMSEHCTPEFFPRSLFRDHPDWFALNNGTRKLGPPPYSGQICYSNKAAIAFYADTLARYAKKHPEFHTIGTWPLDGGQYCECVNCKDPQTIFKAAMQVAEKVKEVRPDIIVEHLSYQAQTWKAPEMDKIPSNMSVLWCPDAGDKTDTLKEWISKSKDAGGVYQFEYYMGDNYRSVTNVWLRPAYAAGVAGYAAKTGLRGVISLYLPIQSWWRSSFNNWFFARSCWDASFNVQDGLKKYYSDYYGEKAPEAEEIFRMIFTKLQHEPYENPDISSTKLLPEIEAASKTILEKINKTISETKDNTVAARFERIKTYVEFFVLINEGFAEKTKPALEKIIGYSKDHASQDMVLMYPGYIKWRLEEDYFQPAH